MKKTKFRFTKENWKNPTPATWRRLGETINVMCSIVAASVYNQIPWIGVTVFVVGLVSRGLVEFFIVD